MADERDDFPAQPVAPTSPSALASTAAQQAAQGFQLATRAYALDQLDIEDPSYAPEPAGTPGEKGDPSASSPTSSTSPTPADSLTPEILREASAAGINADEAKELGTPAAIRRAITLVNRHRAPERQPDPTPPVTPVQPDYLPELPSLAEYRYPKGHEMEGQQILDPQFVQLLEARDKALLDVIEQQRQMMQDVGAVKQTAAQAAAEQVNTRYDNAFNAVPEEYKEAVGTGTYHSMDGKGAQYQTRMKVYLHTEGARQAYLQAKMTPPPFRELFDMALRAVCGGQVAQQVEKKIATQARNQVGQFIARPTNNRNGSAATPPSQAEFDRQNIARLSQRMQEMGWN